MATMTKHFHGQSEYTKPQGITKIQLKMNVCPNACGMLGTLAARRLRKKWNIKGTNICEQMLIYKPVATSPIAEIHLRLCSAKASENRTIMNVESPSKFFSSVNTMATMTKHFHGQSE